MRNRSKHSLPYRRPMLIAGCGDVGLRLLGLSAGPAAVRRRRLRIVATCRRTEQAERIRQLGGTPLMGDLTNKRVLRRLAALAKAGIIWMAPPPAHGETDPASRHMLHALGANAARHATVGISVVYVSTTGVYGDRGGQWTDENTPARPANARAVRRVDAENAWRGRTLTGQNHRAQFLQQLRAVTVLRAPGIYAADRLPIDRIKAGTPAIEPSDDSWSNHIHADDLARLAWRAVFRQSGRRVINAVDDEPMRMGEYFDLVADRFGLPRPPRLPRQTVKGMVSPMMWSFMNESRRLKNRRLRELGIRLRYPTVSSFLS